jgi:Ni,Fe-hydrogenase maturation factor
MSDYEKVEHPDHYQSENIEAIDVIEAFELNFSLGSAVKYILRAGKKPSETVEEDLSKAVWYILREIKRRRK